MIPDSYEIWGTWGPRAETPEELAVRFERLIDRLAAIDPVLDGWIWVTRKRLKRLATIRERNKLFEAIADKVARSDFGNPEPDMGYSMIVVNSVKDTPRTIGIRINAGGWSKFGSYVSLHTHSRLSPDPAIVTYAVFKEALLALVESFEATTCRAYRSDMLDMLDNSEKFRAGWMVYLAPVCARLVTPPQSAIVEHRPDGGLLMAATRETFVTTKPQHMAVVYDIARAIAPLNALPWPLDGSQV